MRLAALARSHFLLGQPSSRRGPLAVACLSADIRRGEMSGSVLKAVIYDLDGTLIDSSADLADSVNALLAELELPALPTDVVTSFIGEGASRLVARALAASGQGLESRTA